NSNKLRRIFREREDLFASESSGILISRDYFTFRSYAESARGRRYSVAVTTVSSFPWPKAAMRECTTNVRFSNRLVWVKRFQAIHQCSVDITRGLVLLFGIGARALPSWDSRTRRNNLSVGLAVRLTAGPSGHAISPHPSSREGHHATARWSSRFLLFRFDLALSCGCGLLPGPAELGAVNPDTMHDHGQSARQCHDRLLHAAAL